MANVGLTKARSIGPIAEEVERAGGSVARIFRHAELPLEMLDQPERLLLLRDQLRLLECAAREIGDEAISARLSVKAGVAGLGRYGLRILGAPRLESAIVRSVELIGPLLQSATSIGLVRKGRWAKWTYRVTDAAEIGRQKNEILALGYMLDLLRRFAGANWQPARAEHSGSALPGRSSVQDALHCAIDQGAVAGISFPAELLDLPNPERRTAAGAAASEVPDAADLVACIEHLLALALLDGRPRIDWLCRRLNLSRRTLQRQLARLETSFDEIMARVLARHATALMADPRRPITAVALDLGYSDPAHFTRAFTRWTGRAPRDWRRVAMRRQDS
jgi:AraC-like DNA-binding protein